MHTMYRPDLYEIKRKERSVNIIMFVKCVYGVVTCIPNIILHITYKIAIGESRTAVPTAVCIGAERAKVYQFNIHNNDFRLMN